MKTTVSIVEVGARDGLQNEAVTLTLGQKLKLIRGLKKAGLQRIEVGAFVSPKWVPQMANSDQVVKNLLKTNELTKSDSVLVPNLKGMERALQSGIKEVAIFAACSEGFSQKNINCSIDESFDRFKPVVEMAKREKIRVRGYLSTAFACPYDGPTPPKRVVKLTQRMIDLGVYEVSIGDTVGVATPKQVQILLKQIKAKIPLKKIAMHFHNTRGTALSNVLQSLNMGIKTFDSSVAGLGGCPYAKGATGNLATEELIYLLKGMGIETGVDVLELIKLRVWLEKLLNKNLPSLVKDESTHGLFKL